MLKLGLLRDLHAPFATLTIPAGPFSAERVHLEGKPTIVRFLCRQFPTSVGMGMGVGVGVGMHGSKLYGALPLDKQAKVDEWISLYRSTTVTGNLKGKGGSSNHGQQDRVKEVLSKLVTEINSGTSDSTVLFNKKQSNKANDLTLADLLAWDIVVRHPGVSTEADAWRSALEQSCPTLVQVCKEIAQVIENNTNILDEFRFSIARELARILGPADMDEEDHDSASVFRVLCDAIFPMIENKFPKDSAGGDFTIAVPRLKLSVQAAIAGTSIASSAPWFFNFQGPPSDLAKQFESRFDVTRVHGVGITEFKCQGVFLKFMVDSAKFRNKLIPKILNQETLYGCNASGFGKIAVVEFSSPNIAKPFHVGHIRSTIMGNFIQNTLKTNGWTTVSLNYLGDWGKQYGLLAIGYTKYGSEEKLIADPIRHLYDVYVKINRDKDENPDIDEEARKYFKKMEEGDTSALALWQRFRDLSIVKYHDIYGRFNVHFDEYSGESKYSALQMRGVVDLLHDMALLSNVDGAQAVDLKSMGLGLAIIEKKDAGGMLYISRDIAAAIHRQRLYKFDNMYYVVGIQQEHHFKQLFKILELMGMPWAERCTHISFGMIKSKDGNMSTRKGTVVFLEDILNNLQESMLEVMKRNEERFKLINDPDSVSDLVGLTAIMIQDMSSRRVKDYEFDWDRMMAFEGDTGPYLQYAHARLRSIERMAGFEVDATVDLSTLTEPPAMALLDIMSMYPDVVREVGISLEPCNTVSFSFKLAHAVMVALEHLYVMNQPREIALARLALYKCARITLGNALRSLGVVPLDRM